jgi:hypothetical protein
MLGKRVMVGAHIQSDEARIYDSLMNRVYSHLQLITLSLSMSVAQLTRILLRFFGHSLRAQ